MRRTLATFAALAFLALPVLAADEPRPATLTVSGEGMVQVTPDIAVITIGVTSRGRTASAALAANSADMGAIVASIKGAGIAEKDIGTSGFSVGPLYEQLPVRADGSQQPPKIVGYEVANTVRVTIRDIARSGALLDKVVTAGANQVNGISFDVSDRTRANDEALTKAIADARRKAALMAEAAGVKLGRILSVASGEGGGYQPAPTTFAMSREAVPVMPGQQSVSANATVVWEIGEK